MSVKYGFSDFFLHFKECFAFSDNVSYMNFLLNKKEVCLNKSVVSKTLKTGLRKKEAIEICVNGIEYYAKHYQDEYKSIYLDKIYDKMDSFISRYYIPSEQKKKIMAEDSIETNLATLLIIAALSDLQNAADSDLTVPEDFDASLNSDRTFENSSDNSIISTDLNTALTQALAEATKPISMRIYALSTTLIHPIVRCAKNCKISDCRLLIRGLRDPEYKSLFAGHVMVIDDLWKMMERDGIIDHLETCYFDSLPSEYNIILNDEIAIIGDYIFTDLDRSHVSIDSVMVIKKTSPTGREIIANYTNRFDRSYEYFKHHGGDKID